MARWKEASLSISSPTAVFYVIFYEQKSSDNHSENSSQT